MHEFRWDVLSVGEWVTLAIILITMIGAIVVLFVVQKGRKDE